MGRLNRTLERSIMMTLNLIPRKNNVCRNELMRGFGPLHRQMDRLFNDFFGELSLQPWTTVPGNRTFMPRLDLAETEKEIHITAELPGLEQEDLELSITDGILTLKGEKKLEQEQKDEHTYHTERSYGTFSRSVQLPAEVDTTKAQATFKNGLLKIQLSKTEPEQAKTKKISIKNE